MDNLTNDAKFLLTSMYAKYIDERKNGIPKEKAIYFGDVHAINKTIMPEWSFEDTRFTCFELHNHKYITGTPASDQILFISLTTEAIAQLETNFKDKLDTVLEYAGKIKNAIPFL